MKISKEFNLVDDCWIPVIMADGKSESLSLSGVFERGCEIADLNVDTLERIALMRILICIAQASTGGFQSSINDFKDKIRDNVSIYLNKWHDRFNLFDEKRPFLQIANVEYEKSKPIETIDIYAPHGESKIFINNNDDDNITNAVLALKLLTYQNFATSGTYGTLKWNGKPTSPTPSGYCGDAVCTAQNALKVYVLKSDLLSTIYANMITLDALNNGIGVQKLPFGKPYWEMDLIDRENPKEVVKNNTRSYLGRLVPISRAVKILGYGRFVTIGNGLKYPSFPEIMDFDCAFKLSKGKLMVLKCDKEKAIWRSLQGILARETQNSRHARPPWAVTQICDEPVKIWAGGIVSNQAKILSKTESTFLLPAIGEDSRFENAVLRYGQLVEDADIGEKTLYSAVKSYESFMKLEESPFKAKKNKNSLFENIKGLYWNNLLNFQEILMELFDEKIQMDIVSNNWSSAIIYAQKSALQSALPCQTGRQICALSLAMQKLYKKRRD